MRRDSATLIIAGAYLWTMMILLGAILLETFMVYPNIFHDPPASLEVAMEFMSVRAPSDFFPPFGLLTWITGLAALVLTWRVKAARYWILCSLLMVAGEGVASMLLFWPRNEIMFIEGTAVHPADVLRQVALEFQRLHWLRVGFNAAAAIAVFGGFLQIHRHRILSSSGRHEASTSTPHEASTSTPRDAPVDV